MRRLFLCCVVLASACVSHPLELSVDVRTDLSPSTDFARVRVELSPAQGERISPAESAAQASDPFDSGVRIADFVEVPAGLLRVRAALLDASGSEVVARAIDMTLVSDYALTVVLSADCVGRSCPGATEPSSFTECLSGHCVEPSCGGPAPTGCGDLACDSDSDCTARLSCIAACLNSACVCVGMEIDAGVDSGPCECVPGEVEDDSQACGQCNEGQQIRTRTCQGNCVWGPFGDFGTCQTSGTCAPGQTDSESGLCGNCDSGAHSRTRTCDSSTCQWGTWSAYTTCTGQSGCTPGDTRGGCDRDSLGVPTDCGIQTCTSSCTWGSCGLASGAQCLSGGGSSYGCCTPASGGSGWRFCSASTCQWFACASHSCP